MRKLLLLIAAALFFTPVFAQTRTITGTVIGVNGNPISNASVTVKGTTIGTTTNDEGAFSLNIPTGSNILVISAVGMQEQEFIIGVSNRVAITLQQGDAILEEVLITAYGTVKKGENTASIAQINAESIKNRPLTNVTSALDGAAPGIQVTTANGQPGSDQAIRIRGFGSINASNDPLYVVDGVPYSGPVSAINMDDVESVTALKDAASTALYGSRGANGVIIITTKKGNKNRSNLSFKTAIGVVKRGIPEYELVNAQQYYPLMWQAYKNSLVYRASNPIPEADAAKIASGQYPRFTTGANAGRQNYNGAAYSDLVQLLGYNAYNVPATELMTTDGTLNPAAKLLWPDDLDWTKELLRTGIRQEYLLSYSGGNDKSDYYSSMNYTKEQGYAIRSDLDRINGRLGANTNPVKWFKTGLNVSASLTKSNTASDASGSTAYVNPFFFARNMGPIYPVYAHNPTNGEYMLNERGEKIYDLGNMTSLGLPARGPGGSPGRHILAETRYNEEVFKRTLLSGRAYGTIIFTPWLDFTTNVGVDHNLRRESVYENKIVGDGAPTGRIYKENNITTSYTWNKLLNVRKSFDVHNFDALIGHENYSLQYNYMDVRRSTQIFDGNTELVNFSVAGTNTSYTDNHTIESYLSRVNYNYDGKYFLSGSFRRDGNSRFKREFRWENFWSVGGAWRLDRENFIASAPWVSELKLRSAYGRVGNDGDIYYYAYKALYGLGYNNGNDPGVIQTNLRNDSITWETSTNFDVALEFSLLKDRINGMIEYYNRVTDGLIFAVPQPIHNGGTPDGGYSINKNIGSLFNRGIELHLDGDIIRNTDFRWNLGVNLSTLKNQITKMPDGQKEIISGTKKYSVGHSIYDYWLREWIGVDPKDGAPLYRSDVYNATSSRVRSAGDTVTILSNNGRYAYVGSAIPKYWGSFTTLFNYKRFELQGTFTYQVGGLVYDGAYAGIMTNGSSYGSSLHIDALKAWQKPGDVTNIPRMDNANGTNNNAQSSRWLIDGSYLNFRNLSLSYNIPESILERITVRNARFFINFENLALFNKRKGMNPQQAFSGVTTNDYSPARITTFGINVNF